MPVLSPPMTVLLGAPMSARMMPSDALTTLEVAGREGGPGRRHEPMQDLFECVVIPCKLKSIHGTTYDVDWTFSSVQHIQLAGRRGNPGGFKGWGGVHLSPQVSSLP